MELVCGGGHVVPWPRGANDENWVGILNSYYDSIRGQYGMFFRYYEPYTWENAEGVNKRTQYGGRDSRPVAITYTGRRRSDIFS